VFTRLYGLAAVVTAVAVWSGSADAGFRLFASGLLLAGVVPCLWFDTLRKSGLRALAAVPAMAGIFVRARRAGFLTGLVVVCLGVWLSPFAAEPSPYRYAMSATLVATVLLLALQPPYLLLLGASSPETGRSLAVVSTALNPLRVVGLLDQGRIGYVVGAFSPFTDNLRTVSDADWRGVVETLIDLVPVIVVDARTDRPVVVEEVGRLLARPDRLRKALFVTDPDGGAPALAAHGLTGRSPGLRVATEADLAARLAELA